MLPEQNPGEATKETIKKDITRQTVGYEEGSRDVNNLTQAKINKNKDLVMCFKCQRQGHFANRCPTRKDVASTKEPVQPKVLIMNGNNDYLIPGVHYAPEVTLNILSINLLKQQGFEIVYEGNRCTLEYMFKNQHERNIDVDKIRQRHNDYLDDYFKSLDMERTDRKEEEPGIVEDTDTPVVQTFQEYVAFLNLIKDDEETSKEWDTYRDRFDRVLKWFYNHYLKRPLPGAIPPIIQGVPIHLFDLYKLMDCMGGYFSVYFGQEFGALVEILGLTRLDGEDIRKCYMTYLEVFVSYYKTARASENPMTGEEDMESLEEYQWNFGKGGASFVVEKGKERHEHFGIKLEGEEDCKLQQSAHYGREESQITCYKCQDHRHYAFECPEKSKEKDQVKDSSYKGASTSKHSEDPYSTPSDDFIIIT
uniref:ARID DNA-binding domain-containing protein n=1 Tax=Tanacetum cinerariifolium TaxID=118510 RepID=A0A6L2J1A4_TANCI|nr:ARID DNA-binding domain-containing protein [Tanacetum cinerariifolium]